MRVYYAVYLHAPLRVTVVESQNICLCISQESHTIAYDELLTNIYMHQSRTSQPKSQTRMAKPSSDKSTNKKRISRIVTTHIEKIRTCKKIQSALNLGPSQRTLKKIFFFKVR